MRKLGDILMPSKQKTNFDMVNNYLIKLFPNPECELVFETPFQAVVAVVLSARCTDKRVNKTTPQLFETCKTPKDFLKYSQEELENIIRPCGTFRNKAKNILATAKILVDKYNGELPQTIEELKTLPGIGQKTANVLYSLLMGGQAIAVDTHVLRLSNRFGFVNTDKPEACELQLQKIVPQNQWSDFHYRMVLFGRYYCSARSPKCEECKLKDYCKFYKSKK